VTIQEEFHPWFNTTSFLKHTVPISSNDISHLWQSKQRITIKNWQSGRDVVRWKKSIVVTAITMEHLMLSKGLSISNEPTSLFMLHFILWPKIKTGVCLRHFSEAYIVPSNFFLLRYLIFIFQVTEKTYDNSPDGTSFLQLYVEQLEKHVLETNGSFFSFVRRVMGLLKNRCKFERCLVDCYKSYSEILHLCLLKPITKTFM